jgi:hypothetical protein
MVPEVAFLEHSVFGRSQAKGDKGREVVLEKTVHRSVSKAKLLGAALEVSLVLLVQVAQRVVHLVVVAVDLPSRQDPLRLPRVVQQEALLLLLPFQVDR